MVFESIAGGLLKAALPKVTGAIATAVKNKLHPGELQRSLTVALQTSGAFDRGQKVNNAVFYRCTDKDADTFLAALLEHPEVQRELQKPLEQDGAPDVAILVQAAKQIAADRTLDIPDDTLEPWLKTFANAYFDAITAIRFQVAKADYLEQLANWFDDVKFAGVAVPGQDVERAERLAQIFVMPDVEEEGRRGLGIEGLRGWGDEGVTDDRQSQLLQEQRLRSQLERSGRKFSARQLLQQHQKTIVLLGAPGSGKTTLMSFFAVTLAERQTAIATVSDAHAKGIDRSAQGIDANTEGIDRDRSQIDRRTEGFDRDAEGIDRDRSQIDRHTEGFDRDRSRMYPDAEGLFAATQPLPLPILIRIRDWALHPDQSIPEYARQFAEKTMHVKPLPKGFFEHWLDNGQALILLDGLDEVAEASKRHHLVQCIENFLGQYPQNRAIITSRPAGYRHDFFRAEEFPHYELQPFDDQKIEEFCDRWYTSRVQDTAEAQRRKESLQKALNQQDRIKLLARNPLLLTIIALIHRNRRLPKHRHELYKSAIETLLTVWDEQKEWNGKKELSIEETLDYLKSDDIQRLMEHLAYWIHTQGNTGDADGGTLIDKDELIRQLTQEIKTLKQLQLYEAKEEAKRFVEFIRDRTGLLNEQGQDCYAFVHKTFQEYLTAQEINYQADNEDDFEIVLTHIDQHLHDPRWREVLLLLIAQQSPKKAARAIRKVLTANSPYEQWLHRDLLFAGRCLSEDPKGLQAVDSVLISESLDGFIALCFLKVKQTDTKIQQEVFQILRSLQESAFEAEAVQRLKQNAIRVYGDELLGYVWLESCEVFQILRSLQESAFEAEAVQRLEQNAVRVHSDELQRCLKLKNYEAAIVPLPLSGRSSDEAAIVLWLDLLNSLKWCDEFFYPNIEHERSVKLKNASEELLLTSLNDPDFLVRSDAAKELGRLGHVSKDILQALVTALNDPDFDVRYRAIEALGKLGHVSEEILQALLIAFNNEATALHSITIEALGKLGKRSNQVEPAIVQWIEQHQDEDCVGAGIDALWEIVDGKG